MIDPKGGERHSLVVWTDTEGIVPSLLFVASQRVPFPQATFFGIHYAEPGIYAAFEARKSFRAARMLFEGNLAVELSSKQGFSIREGSVMLVLRHETFNGEADVTWIVLPDPQGGYVYRKG